MNDAPWRITSRVMLENRLKVATVVHRVGVVDCLSGSTACTFETILICGAGCASLGRS